jgi:S-(hydroxymethyl)glutathione dehydrogenase / alcohol dehydrogenase
MKAAVCYGPGTPPIIEDIDIDPPQAGEVKVRLVATAICHSDIHAMHGDWNGNFPVVVGHEAAGIVEEVGENVTLTAPGDNVVVSLLRSCGRCFYCMQGQLNLCNGAFALDTESRLHNKEGELIYQGIRTAAFAEYVIVDQSQVIQVPQTILLEKAALLACGVITGVGAVINTAQVKPGSSVVVIGLGGVGLNAIQGAVLAGASKIIAMDILDTKLDTAKMFGATHTLNARREDARRVVRDFIGGLAADYVFVTVGSTTAVSQGLTLLRRAGTLVIVGMPPSGATAPLSVVDIADKGLRIFGSFMGSTRLRVDVPWLVDLYRQGRLKLDELITGRFSIEQINEAIELMERGEAIRNLIIW